MAYSVRGRPHDTKVVSVLPIEDGKWQVRGTHLLLMYLTCQCPAYFEECLLVRLPLEGCLEVSCGLEANLCPYGRLCELERVGEG